MRGEALVPSTGGARLFFGAFLANRSARTFAAPLFNLTYSCRKLGQLGNCESPKITRDARRHIQYRDPFDTRPRLPSTRLPSRLVSRHILRFSSQLAINDTTVREV